MLNLSRHDRLFNSLSLKEADHFPQLTDTYPRHSIGKVFIIQGGAIGLVGTAVGTLGGLVLARLVDSRQLIALDPSVYFIDHLPVQVMPWDVVAIVVLSVLVAVGATILPARRASLLTPVEAIRHE